MWKYYYKESSLEYSSLDILDDEYPALAGPNNNSKQKSGPHIDVPFFPTLSNSCIGSYKIIVTKGKTQSNTLLWILYLIVNVNPIEGK